MVNLWFVGNGEDTPQGDLETNVSQQLRGIKGDKKIESCLIMRLIWRRKSADYVRKGNSESAPAGQVALTTGFYMDRFLFSTRARQSDCAGPLEGAADDDKTEGC